jgi:SAM-dependent methyltransferase
MEKIFPGKIDLIIPTMWRCSEFPQHLEIYAASEDVNAIIIIDNDPAARPFLPHTVKQKLKLACHGKNIFVNPAWNLGFSLSTAPVLAIINDDIRVDLSMIKMMAEFDWVNNHVDIIGVDVESEHKTTTLRKIEVTKEKPLGLQYHSFGACMFMPRECYRIIPDDVKIWYGDDYLVHAHKNIYLLGSPLIAGNMSTTLQSFPKDSEVRRVLRSDIEYATKHLFSPSAAQAVPVPPAQEDEGSVSVDLGCGDRPRNPFKASRLIGIDPQIVSPNTLSCWVGFEPIPLGDSSVDYVTAYDFIEHLPRFALREKPFNPFIDAMSEIWRILKPGGIFLARTPAYPSAAAFQDPTHVNIITDQTVSYFSRRPCVDGTFVDDWGLPLGKRYGFKGEFELIKQWWDTTHLCWKLKAIK